MTRHRPIPSVLPSVLLVLAYVALLSGCGDDPDGTAGDPCTSATCDPIATCSATGGSAVCTCPTGFQDVHGDGSACIDIDECAGTVHGCAEEAVCVNWPGGHTCLCPTGYEGDGETCVDIDECTTGEHGCDPLATCTNTEGSYACMCPSGFLDLNGDGSVCDDIDECWAGSHICDPIATCTNTAGGHACTCPSGYEDPYLDGRLCLDLDECSGQGGGHDCDSLATCTDIDGGYECTCPDGYEDVVGNGTLCLDFDECAGQGGGNDCDPHAICTDIDGGYQCDCQAGFEDVRGDGTVCLDYDECAGEGGGNDCDLDAICTNEDGTFLCDCANSYVGDGRTCILTDSCFELLTAKPGLPSGSYTIELDGVEVTVYCDMVTDGGGWTHRIWGDVLAYFSFDGGDPTTADIGAYSGLLEGTAAQSIVALTGLGESLAFDGSETSRMTLATRVVLPPASTVLFWARHTDCSNNEIPLLFSDDTSYMGDLYYPASLYVLGAGTVFLDSTAICTGSVNTWSHHAYVDTGTEIRVYRNGALVTPTSYTYRNLAGLELHRLGSRPGFGTNGLAGNLDELIVFGRALTEQEIQTIHGEAVNHARPFRWR